MDPAVLTVYACPFPKVRVGKEYDGGYVIALIPGVKYSTLISGGIAGDISFEERFLYMYESAKCIAYDGTIASIPSQSKRIEFVKKNIGSENSDTLTNIHEVIDGCNETIFVKMDIEGGEVPWVKSLKEEQLNKFDQIVMEFHTPFSDNEVEVFDKINKNHVLVHFHANNCCGTREYKGVTVPNIFECTYVHKKYFAGTAPVLNTDAIPSIIDMRNISWKDEIHINYPPFVN